MKTIKELTALIGKIKNQTAARREMIQEALVVGGFYALRDRNTDPLIRLFDAVGNETNLKAMGAWIRASEVIPVHFEGGKPILSDKKQKEIVGSCATSLEAEYMARIEAMPKWYEKADADNTPEKGWDSVEFSKSVADYLAKAAKKAGKHDAMLKSIIEQAEMVLRAKVNDAEHAE